MRALIHNIKPLLPAIILAVIVLFAAYLRLFRIDQYLTFLGDEGRDVLVVKRMIVDHKFTLLGPTASVGGFFLGPIYYYFMLPFLWAWNLDPVGPAVMVGLFGTATVILVYITGKSLFGTAAGLIAASLFAFSPLVIAYSRSSWNPNVVPFFSTLLILFLWRVRMKKHRWDPFVAGIALGIGIQLHYLFLFLFVVAGIWYVLIRKHIDVPRVILWTIAGILVGASPFIAFELRHQFANTRTILQFLFTGKETGFSGQSYMTIVGDVSFRLFSRLLFRMPSNELWNSYPDWYIGTLTVLTHLTRIIAVLSLAVLAVKRKWTVALELLAIWSLTVILLFGFYQKGIYDYYFGIFFAFPFLFVGALAQQFWKGRTAKILAGFLWAFLLLFNWQGRPFVYPPNNQLNQVRTIARTAFDPTGGKPFNFALVTTGNSDHAYRYFFEIWGNPPVTIQNTDVDPERNSVTDQLIVICETMDCKPLGHPLWEIAGFGPAEIAGEWEAPFVKIYKLVHVKD